MVDVQLAVDALLMASRGLFSKCTLLTGDLDFKPLVDALVEMGVDVHLLYPNGETTEDLKASADQADPLAITTLRDWISAEARQSLPMVMTRMHGVASSTDPIPLSLEPLVEWRDDRYGDCRVGSSDSAFVLMTTRLSEDSRSHYLCMSASDAAILRAYAEDGYGLRTPPW
jgi:hypothetical protein